tara:strand:- start:1884 stop:2504 length:621 start_codon:yes stop_codon:yes gene_type:complete
MGLIAGAAILGVAGAGAGYMASMEQTANANNQAWASYLNKEHQARLQIQRENDKQIRGYQKQLLQNLYIGRAATQTKIRNKASLKRAAMAQSRSLHNTNKAAFDLLKSSIGSRNVSSSSGTARALKRQALHNWSNSSAALTHNLKQQDAQIDLQYQNTLAQMGTDEFLTNSYIGGQAPQMIDGTWSAIAAGVSGGTSAAGSMAAWK